MQLLFKYPIEIGVDVYNCCKGKTKRLGLHGDVVSSKYNVGRPHRNGSPQHTFLHALQKISSVSLLNVKIEKLKGREMIRDYLGLVWDNLLQLLRSNTYQNYGPICTPCTVDLW